MKRSIEVRRSRSTKMEAMERYSRVPKLGSTSLKLSMIIVLIMRSRVAVLATTVALVGAPSTNDISPKN